MCLLGVRASGLLLVFGQRSSWEFARIVFKPSQTPSKPPTPLRFSLVHSMLSLKIATRTTKDFASIVRALSPGPGSLVSDSLSSQGGPGSQEPATNKHTLRGKHQSSNMFWGKAIRQRLREHSTSGSDIGTVLVTFCVRPREKFARAGLATAPDVRPSFAPRLVKLSTVVRHLFLQPRLSCLYSHAVGRECRHDCRRLSTS